MYGEANVNMYHWLMWWLYTCHALVYLLANSLMYAFSKWRKQDHMQYLYLFSSLKTSRFLYNIIQYSNNLHEKMYYSSWLLSLASFWGKKVRVRVSMCVTDIYNLNTTVIILIIISLTHFSHSHIFAKRQRWSAKNKEYDFLGEEERVLVTESVIDHCSSFSKKVPRKQVVYFRVHVNHEDFYWNIFLIFPKWTFSVMLAMMVISLFYSFFVHILFSLVIYVLLIYSWYLRSCNRIKSILSYVAVRDNALL